ncbi:MAG TPA: hypothetical protein PLY93_01460, partial [Turneriella sp.]|nr:hypothetical protein [Turneriella sp.]
NKFLLNNGLHTAHHEQMGLHWSQLPAAHDKIKHLVDPSLNHRSLGWYIIRTYFLAPFVPSFREESMRLKRMTLSTGGSVSAAFEATAPAPSKSSGKKSARNTPKRTTGKAVVKKSAVAKRAKPTAKKTAKK